jgi:hypothetical protein
LKKSDKIKNIHQRIRREWETIDVMIKYYCKKNHLKKELLCSECKELHEYAYQRLINCPFEEDKPVCSNCKVHCYKKDMREQVRKIMRFSGPRMLLNHPYLAIRHLIDEKLSK